MSVYYPQGVVVLRIRFENFGDYNDPTLTV
jgi:hypothetical protein